MKIIKIINYILLFVLITALLVGGGIYFIAHCDEQTYDNTVPKVKAMFKGTEQPKETPTNTESDQPALTNQSGDLVSIKQKIKQIVWNSTGLQEDLLSDEAAVNRDIFAETGVKPELNIGKTNYRFAVIADAESYKDPRGYNPEMETVLDRVRNEKTDLVFFSGDLISASGPSAADNRNRMRNMKSLIERYIQQKYYIVFGQHDVECGVGCIDDWQETFFKKTYETGEKRILYHAFDYGNTHFVLLATDYPLKHSIDDEQLKWLEDDLAKTQQPNKIVFAHVPPVTFFQESAKKCHDMTCSPTQRDKLINILKRHQVDVVISGHEHTFDHKIVDGIDYVLAGNSGNGKRYKNTIAGDIYTVVQVNETHINLKSMDTEGNVIREIPIK